MLPVGSIYGGDAVTGAELDTLHELKRGSWLEALATAEMYEDREGDGLFELSFRNPTDRVLRWSLADVGRDASGVSGLHAGRLDPGEAKELRFEVQGGLPRFTGRRPDVRLEVRLEYDLASGLSQTIASSVQARVQLPELASLPSSGTNHALRLDGRSALRVDVPEPLDALTLEAWVRGAATAERTGLIAKTQGSAFGIFWAEPGHTTPGGFVHSQRLPGGSAGYASVWAPEPWDYETWSHLALSWDGQVVRLFVNGALQGEAACPAPATWNRHPLWIGADPDGRGRAMSFFTGELDEVRLSSVARYTEPFEPQREPFTPDEATELLLHLDACLGDLHPDASGRERHGWAQGQPQLVEVTR